MCDVILGFVLGSDLSVESVQVLYSGDEISGLRITFNNEGMALEGVGYVVVFSTDATISTATDYVVYEGAIDFDRNSEKQVDLSGSKDIQPYIEQSMTEIPDGTYFLGVFIDPDDDFDEDSESNNEGVSATDFLFTAAGPDPGGDPGLFPDGFEPNDNFNEWATLAQGWNFANLHTPSDEDWFEIYQEMDMSLTIETRPGPNNLPVDVIVEAYRSWDPLTLVYTSGPAASTNTSIYIPMMPAMMETWRVRVYSPTGQVGEYEIQSYSY